MGSGPLPPRPIILTFDDGSIDHYQFAYPILQKHHFSGMFSIITGRVGMAWQMDWPQLREMLKHGMQMGSHTIHHIDLVRAFPNSKAQPAGFRATPQLPHLALSPTSIRRAS